MSSNIDFWSFILNSEETSKLLDNKTITICLLSTAAANGKTAHPVIPLRFIARKKAICYGQSI